MWDLLGGIGGGISSSSEAKLLLLICTGSLKLKVIGGSTMDRLLGLAPPTLDVEGSSKLGLFVATEEGNPTNSQSTLSEPPSLLLGPPEA